MSDRGPKEHRTVSRVTTILETAAEAPRGVSLADLTTVLDAAKSSVHGLVKGLVATGYLQEHRGAYTLGPAIAMLPAPSRPAVLETARLSLEDIERQCEESVMLSMLVGDSVIYADIVESRHHIRYAAPLGVRRPLYPTSAGKCFLAYMTPTRRANYLRSRVPDEEERAEIQLELDEVRAVGYSTNRGQTVPDVYAVSSPIFVSDRVVGCLTAAGPSGRFEPKIPDIARLLKAECARLAQSRG